MLRIPLEQLRRIEDHGRAAFPEEACGFLLGTTSPDGSEMKVSEAQPATNEKQEERTRRYLIEPLQLMAAEDRASANGLDVIGFYHSHPSGAAAPSEFDRAHAWPWYAYVVTAVTAKGAPETTAWKLCEDRSGFDPLGIVTKPEP